MIRAITVFPVSAVLISLVSLFYPDPFIELKWSILPLLGVIMLGMGATLSLDDFKRILVAPGPVAAGLLLQYSLMPLIAWLLSLFLQLPLPVMTGLVLVGACPGGTASNVICYLARGNVALSITMTTLSTFLAVLLTPFLTWLYLGESIPVPVADMMISIFQIIILPVSLGLLLNHYLGQRYAAIKTCLPWVSMTAIVLIIGIIVALNQNKIETMILSVLLAVVLHNFFGLICGYALSRCMGFDHTTCKTLAIEVGMQNSGLGVALASKYFVPLAALPGAVFSIWHNISGAFLASYWSNQVNGNPLGQTGSPRY